jgi:hypothetical protein
MWGTAQKSNGQIWKAPIVEIVFKKLHTDGMAMGQLLGK